MGLARHYYFEAKTRLVYWLDEFVGRGPLLQATILFFVTSAIVLIWALAFWWAAGFPAAGDTVWWSLTRMMDGGTFAGDRGRWVRLVGTGVTGSGILLISLLTGAITSKLSERIDDLRSGRSPVVVHNHFLILGFDAKVPLIV